MTLATQEDIVDAELIATDDEKRNAIDGLAEYVEGVWPRVLHLIDIRAWELPEYTDFDDMWEKRIAPLGLSIGRAKERPEIVSRMREIGQKQQDIASKLRVSLRTIKSESANLHFDDDATYTNSRGQERPLTHKKKEKEMPATLEHQSPFAVGHALVVPGNGKALAFVGEDGRAASNSETMRDALEWAREHPEQSRTDAADESGLSAGTLGNAYTALRNNHEIYRRNRLVERFDSIAQGLTYVADDLESLTADLERATAEDLEFGREYFEDAMKKLNAFRKALNAKY